MPNTDALTKVEARLVKTTGERWELALDRDGIPVVEVFDPDGTRRLLRAQRDHGPASLEDVRFIASSRADVRRLIDALRGKPMEEVDLADIRRRCEEASPTPWQPFLESDGGLGGCSVIRVSDHDEEPDLYLWLEDEIAPDADFDFVANARQDIPFLLSSLRLET
jgi:hypothetical protein